MAEKSAEVRRAERELKALKVLTSSDGWKVIEDVMRQEILTSAYKIADPSFSTDNNVHFYRGALWAATQLIHIPDRLMMNLESQLSLSATARQGTSE